MRIQELKHKTREVWERLHRWKDGVTLAPETFEQVTQRLGDRRCKSTWIKVYARFKAEYLLDWYHDAYIFIAHDFGADQPYRAEVLDHLLSFPNDEGLKIVKDALETVYATSPQSTQEFFILLESRGPIGGADRLPARPVGELPRATSPAIAA